MLRNSIKLFQVNRSVFNQRNAGIVARFYAVEFNQHAAEGSFLNKNEVSERVINVLKRSDKVDPAIVSGNSHFVRDLGLDSLDTADIINAIEQEFVIEIPNEEAFKLQSIRDVVNYVATSPIAK